MPVKSTLGALPAGIFANHVQRYLGTEWCTLIHLTRAGGGVDMDEFVRRKRHEAWLIRSFPPSIRELFGGTEAMQTLPRQAWRRRYLGSTQYVDGIAVGELPSDAAVVVGEDEEYCRPYAAFLLHNGAPSHN